MLAGMRHKTVVLALGLVLLVVTGCGAETEHGCCEPPKENLEWFYIEQEAPSLLGAIYGSNKWCVVCDASIAEEDVLEWLKANAYGGSGTWANDEDGEVDEDGLLPCLFANTNGDSAVECQSAICQGDAREVFNDIVWPDYGAAKIIAPLLER